MPKKKVEEKSVVQTKEAEEIPAETELVVTANIVTPAVSTEQALASWNAYQELVKKLLASSDYQAITLRENRGGQWIVNKKSFKKKSAWRKLATVFNLSVEVIKEERKQYQGYFVHEVTTRAKAMNGRSMDGVGSCASNERGFAHLEHDVRSTAATRATNRAIADLIGAGEVSAEEMEGITATDQATTQVKQESCTVDHEALPVLNVKKEGKNHGRPYKVCQQCKWWRWMDVEKKEEPKVQGEEL